MPHPRPTVALSTVLLATTVAAQSPFALSRHPSLPMLVTGSDIQAGDVDADGDIDLVVANKQNPNQLWLNDGRGGFVDATAGRLVTPAVPPPGAFLANSTNEIDLADIDGDGDLDLLMVNDWDLPDRVYENNGSGFFTDVTATAVQDDPEWGTDQVVADLDGDGDVDWLVMSGSTLRLLRNDGTGVFQSAPVGSTPAFPFTNPTGSFAADLDQDGDLDVVLGQRGTSFPTVYPPRILQNQGNAVFTLTPASTIPLPGICHAADVDGDGMLDLLATDGTQLLRNLGGLSFAPPVVLPSNSLVSLDFDLDGDADLLGSNMLMSNDGTGAFASLPSGVTLDFGLAATCIADFDGDGDLDAVEAASSAHPSVRFNFFCQLHTLSDPTLGASYSLELVMPVRASPVVWAPAVANHEGQLVIPGFEGVLRLDPLQALPLWAMFSTGSADRITWTIPNVPALVGTKLHYQAAVLDPQRPPFLGNAIRDVIQ